MSNLSRLLFSIILCLSIFTAATALGQSTIATRATEDVSVMICPACDGRPFSSAMTFGGIVVMDATIEVYLRDVLGLPIANVPFEEIWVDNDSLCFCPGTADFNTDVTGYTEFALSPCGGGCMETPALDGYWMGNSFSMNPLPFIKINSPDMNCDGKVNLTDLGMFASVYGSNYYCADFYWDGVVNLSDLGLFAKGAFFHGDAGLDV